MKKPEWRDDEILNYLEYKLLNGTATQNDELFYEQCTMFDKLIHNNHRRKLVKEMNSAWNN